MSGPGATTEEAIGAALPFWVMLWIAGAEEQIGVAEVAAFRKMLERRSWCKSALAKRLLPGTVEAYPYLWSSYARKELVREFAAVERGIYATAQLAEAEDFTLWKRDLTAIAGAVARSTSGFLGLGSIGARKQAAMEQFRSLLARVEAGAERTEETPFADDPGRTTQETPVFSEPEVARWIQGRIRLRCVEIIDETADVKTFRFVGEPVVLFVYQPGQFLTLDLTIDGARVQRSYSISSSPTRPHAIEITVKRVPGGLVSNWLHDNVKPGFRVNVSGPSGKFSCMPQPAEQLLLLSAGSGITPAMSMARALFDQRKERRVDVAFLHSARSLSDVPFLGELEAMRQRWPRFRLGLVLTRPDPQVPWDGPTGRLGPAHVLELAPAYRQRTIYACGPTPFMEHARGVLTELGFPLKNFLMESFGGVRGADDNKSKRPQSIAELLPTPSRRPATLPPGFLRAPPPAATTAAANKLPKVIFARAGREVAHDGQTPLLELAERLGVTIPSACRAGVCGTCKVKVTSGEVKMECSDGLSGEDRKLGRVLSCVGIPVGPVVVEA